MCCYSGNLHNVHEAIVVQTSPPTLCEPMCKQRKRTTLKEKLDVQVNNFCFVFHGKHLNFEITCCTVYDVKLGISTEM